MNKADVFKVLDEQGIVLAEQGGRLLLRSRGRVTNEARKLAREHKDGLLTLTMEAGRVLEQARRAAHDGFPLGAIDWRSSTAESEAVMAIYAENMMALALSAGSLAANAIEKARRDSSATCRIVDAHPRMAARGAKS